MNRNGAIAGMVVGGLTTIVWNALSGGVFDIYELLPAFVFACIAIYIVSKATGKPSKKFRKNLIRLWIFAAIESKPVYNKININKKINKLSVKYITDNLFIFQYN